MEHHDNLDQNSGHVLLWIQPHRYRPRGGLEIVLVAFFLAVLLLAGCDTKDDDDRRPLAVYEVLVADQETFRLAVSTEEQRAIAEQRLAEGTVGIIHGTVTRGDGGFNAPYSWHLDPATITFPDLTMELCDGRPESDVEADVNYWVNTVRYYCPWGAQIVARVATE